jgi:hypothetical protein
MADKNTFTDGFWTQKYYLKPLKEDLKWKLLFTGNAKKGKLVTTKAKEVYGWIKEAYLKEHPDSTASDFENVSSCIHT